MEARAEALMESFAVALMQANGPAADSPEYEALAKTVAYALDLAETGLLAESNTFGAWEPPRAHRPQKALCYHSGCQGTYSRILPPRLDSLTNSRNTASTASLWFSSLVVVLVPSHSGSIQRRDLVLASVHSLPVSPTLWSSHPVTRAPQVFTP